ncbi:type II secretion system F family protein [Microvirga sp. 0TCS3.31]
MLSPEHVPVATALLATLCAAGIVIAIFYSHVAQRSDRSKRLAAVARASSASVRRQVHDDGRKKTIDATLRELEERQQVRRGEKPSLGGRLRQAGLNWSNSTYYIMAAGSGVGSFLAAVALLNLAPLTGAGFGLAGGMLLPHLYVSMVRARRLARFAAEFPNAVDVIVRGVKSGLPLADCLRIISVEAQEPVRNEFKTILEDQTVGMTIDQAVHRLSERIPLPEANFFAIVISLQSQTGGSLSETLGNLSKVLRERKKMRAKIKAVSSEAKASAAIIGSLPVVVAGAIYVTSPDYISLLFTTLIGNMVIGASALWMLIGIVIMTKMINFDI